MSARWVGRRGWCFCLACTEEEAFQIRQAGNMAIWSACADMAPVPLRLSVPRTSTSACASTILSFPPLNLHDSAQDFRQHPFSHPRRSLRSTPSSRTLVLARASAAVPAALHCIEPSCISHVFVLFRPRSLFFPTLHQHSHSYTQAALSLQ